MRRAESPSPQNAQATPVAPRPRRCGPARAGAAIVLTILLGALLLSAGCSASAQDKGLYYCPMHPQVTADKAGDCPICGMHLVLPAATGPVGPTPTWAARFVCPMHPQVTADKAGDCPICGMHLVQEAPGKGPAQADLPAGLAAVTVASGVRERMGVTTGEVQKRPMIRSIRASGRITPDETQIYRVIARVEGFVDQLFVPYAGARVARGQPLLGVNSPNLLSVQQQFLNASPSDGRRFVAPPTRPGAPSAESQEKGDDTQRQRLKYWDFSDEQIDRIQQSGKAETSLILVAPAGGFVTEKNALLGQKVFPGDLLMVVTNLSRVWAEADVPEMDAPSIQVGMRMVIRPTSLPGRAFEGRVKFFQPLLDPQSHTMKVVVELPNPQGTLKPGMLASAELESGARDAVAVPEGAVLRTGESDYAFVEEGERFVPRAVVLGARANGCFEVLSGLKEGERVVTSATFLVDSESSLQASLQAARAQR